MLKRKPKVLTPEQIEEIRTKDFFDCILPGTLKLKSGGNDMNETIEVEGKLQDVIELLANLRKNREPLLHCVVYIELKAKSLEALKELQSEIMMELTRSKISVDQLTLRQKEGFLSVLPVWMDGRTNMSKYDRMVEQNRERSEEKITTAAEAIEFKIWRYRYSRFAKKFEKQEFETSFENRFGKIVFAGDQKQSLVKELLSILKKKYGSDYKKYTGQQFDMEPFEALVVLLRKAKAQDTIGGAPQMVKIYSHMNCKPIGVYWPKEVEGEPDINRTLLGRKLFNTEKCDYSFINPDTCYSCKRQF